MKISYSHNFNQWSVEIDKLKSEADESKVELYHEIEALQSMKEEASSKLIELKDASEDSWENM